MSARYSLCKRNWQWYFNNVDFSCYLSKVTNALVLVELSVPESRSERCDESLLFGLHQMNVTHEAPVSSLMCPAHLVDYGPAAASSTLPGS